MGKRSAPWRLLGACMAAALFASAGAGLLMAATRGGRSASRKPASRAAQAKPKAKAPAVPAAVPTVVAPAQPSSGGEVEIIAPEQGASLRGTAVIRGSYSNPMGYVIFRIDGEFAYATTPPFQMKWDTTSALDGQHVISIDAYDGSARYVGSASISVVIENAIPTPPDGVLLTVRFDEHDMLARAITARGELSALAADEALPPGFEALSGEFRAEVTTSVMDTFYEGATTLVRSRLRTAALTLGGRMSSTSDVGQYEMLQVSRNGLAVPVATATAKPRVGLAEMSFALRDFPVVPGDTWESPIGAVCDLYSRRAVFVEGQHVFEGLRWFRGRECAVITSIYAIPELPIYSPALAQQPAQQARADQLVSPAYQVVLTGGMRGGGGRGGRGGGMRGGRGSGGGMRGGMGGGRGGAAGGGRGGRGGAVGGAGGQRPGAAAQVQSARLVDLQGTRRTYLTRTGRVLHTEDTILGQVQFVSGSQVARSAGGGFAVELTGMGGMRGGGGRGGRGGGGGMGGGRGARGGAAQGGRAGRAGQAPGAAGPKSIPAKLDYGFRMTTDLIAQ